MGQAEQRTNSRKATISGGGPPADRAAAGGGGTGGKEAAGAELLQCLRQAYRFAHQDPVPRPDLPGGGQSKRYNTIVAVLMLAVDAVHRVNETLGHDAGDLSVQGDRRKADENHPDQRHCGQAARLHVAADRFPGRSGGVQYPVDRSGGGQCRHLDSQAHPRGLRSTFYAARQRDPCPCQHRHCHLPLRRQYPRGSAEEGGRGPEPRRQAAGGEQLLLLLRCHSC